MPGTVLVVEDDPVILDLLEVTFAMDGWTVLRAADGDTALAVAAEARPDVVVSDVMMPGRSGLDLLVALRADGRTAAIPVVLVSARALPDEVRASLAAGADDYVTKPFDPDDLVARTEALLAGAGRRRDQP